jgi:plasmid stabilization system protein ParE
VSYPLVILPEAEEDMAEAFDWYENRRIGLGHEFLGEVRARLAHIEENPLHYTVVYRDARNALVRRFPYKVLYLFEANKVEVFGVVHVGRHPRFWQKRL